MMAAPVFKHIERSEYELPQLLKTIASYDRSKLLDDEARETVEAAASHAYNTKASLLSGVEAIGNLLVQIGQLPNPISQHDLLGVGGLIRHSAVQLQHVIDVEFQMSRIMDSDNEIFKKGGAK
jgi:hypothetical protein